jgi:hypothetical protein
MESVKLSREINRIILKEQRDSLRDLKEIKNEIDVETYLRRHDEILRRCGELLAKNMETAISNSNLAKELEPYLRPKTSAA